MRSESTMCKSILVTGGAGFIGSNFTPYFINKYPEYKIINVDKLTYAADLTSLKNLDTNPRYKFIQEDICNRQAMEEIFEEFKVEGVIHFAAESHVDNSIEGPEVFIKTNINGTFVLLDVARGFWMTSPHNYKANYANSRFLQVSTDEVYGSLGKEGLFTEETPYAPNSPYSASKAGADMLVRSYYHTYGFNVVTTNCSNNYGPKQHDEKLIPTIIRKALKSEQIPIYGDGKNVRDWLYVLDHCKAIDLVYHLGVKGETYNIGGNNERENIYIARTICEILDQILPSYKRGQGLSSYKELITYVSDRPGHDKRYAIDASKIETKLGWKAEENFESGIKKTIDYYLKKYLKDK